MTRQPNPDAAPLRPDPADGTTPDTVEAVRNAIGNAIFDTVESDVLACALTTSELAIIAQAAIAAMQPENAAKPDQVEAVALGRWGVRWDGPHSMVAEEMPDGYWTPWHLAQAAIAAMPAQVVTDGTIHEIIRSAAELPDRTSPDDWPEAMLVTQDELRDILEAALGAKP
jgi:hypothetical protein